MKLSNSVFLLASVALARADSGEGLPYVRSLNRILQVPPPPSAKSISLYPALHPNHDVDHLDHLVPQISHELYFAQEGHRMAVHGSKHAQAQTKFVRPTVVLEHSSHVKRVTCGENDIKICFASAEAADTVRESWTVPDLKSFNLVTYHPGCGVTTGEERSYFHVTGPVFHNESDSPCVTVPATEVDMEDAIESGRLQWGTYASPDRKRGPPPSGHMRVVPDDRPGASGDENVVNLDDDPVAIDRFFQFDVDTNQPDYEVMPGLQFLDMDDDTGEEKRGIRKLLKSALSGLRSAFGFLIKPLAKAGKEVAKFLWFTETFLLKLGARTILTFMIALGYPTKHTLHRDIHLHRTLQSKSGDAPIFFGLGNGLVLARPGGGADGWFICAKCGVHVEMDMEGWIDFTSTGGIGSGELILKTEKPIVVDMQLVMSLRAKGVWSKEKKLVTFAPTPFKVVGLISLGPAVVWSVSASAYIDALAQVLLGGTLTLSPGRAVIDLGETRKENVVTGFHRQWKDVSNIKPVDDPDQALPPAEKGKGGVTLELSMPIQFEFGIILFRPKALIRKFGKFNLNVGLVEAPSVFLSLGLDTESKDCRGVALNVGVRNRLYTTTFGLWEYEFSSKESAKKLACYKDGDWVREARLADGTIFNTSLAMLDAHGAPTNQTAPFYNITAAMDRPNRGYGFYVLTDRDGTTVMVSGSDGYVYFVDAKTGNQLNPGWGTLNITDKLFNFDVFGRLLYHTWVPGSSTMVEVQVASFFQMPKNARVASLGPLPKEKKTSGYGADVDLYSVAFVEKYNLNNTDLTKLFRLLWSVEGQEGVGQGNINDEYIDTRFVWYPTVCKVPHAGPRLYATSYVVKKKGKATTLQRQGDRIRESDASFFYAADRRRMGFPVGEEDCRTVQLVAGA